MSPASAAGADVSIAAVASGKNKPERPAPPWLGRNIKHFRERMGLSVEALRERLEVDYSGIKGLEAPSHRRWARLSTLDDIARALGVEVGDLLADPDAPRSKELAQFLSSPHTEDEFGEITDEETRLLKRTHAAQHVPTFKTYWHELHKLRSMVAVGARGAAPPGPDRASTAAASRRRRLGGGSEEEM